MIKAIIVDDEPAVSSLITHFIEKEHIPIEIVGTASNGKMAVELIRKQEPHIVFLDIQMPFMNGFEVMQTMPEPAYIIITAYESFEYAQRALRLGAKDILLKPIEYKNLIEAIRRAVGWQFTSNSLVNDILEYINTHYTEKVELNEIADIFYAKPSHIARVFKKYVGKSVITYLHNLRIEKAREMLQEGKYTVKEVAENVGYYSLNNFYKYFKNFTGETPAAFIAKGKTPGQGKDES